MIVDTSEEATWALSDAVVARDRAAAVRAAQRLSSQGEAITPIIYQAARRLRDAQLAASELEAWHAAPRRSREGSACTPMRRGCWFAASRGTSSLELRAATCAVADLEWWTRGGSEYPDDVALTLAVLRAAGAGAGAGLGPRPAGGTGVGASRGGLTPRRRRRVAPRGPSCARRCWRGARPSGPPCRCGR